MTARQVISRPDVPTPALPYSQAVRAGQFLFLAGQVATDFQTGIAPDARVDSALPNHTSASRRQVDYIMANAGRLLEAGGSSLRNVVHMELLYADLDQARHVLGARDRFMGGAIPATTGLRAGRPMVPDALFTIEIVGLVPASGLRVEPVRPTNWPAPIHGSSVAVKTGDLVWTGGAAATDFSSDAPYYGAAGTAVAREARANPNFWYDAEIDLQTRFALLKKLRIFLEAAGTSFEHVVKATVYLLDAADYWGFEQVWKVAFPIDPPALTVFPMDVYRPTGCRVEIRLVATIPGGRLKKETIQTDRAPTPLGHSAQATRAGNLLFLSGQLACDDRSIAAEARVNPALPFFGSSAKQQMRVILRNTRALCEAAGTSLDNVIRGHLYFTNPEDVYPAFEVWKEAFPVDPPAATVLLAPGPLLVPGCTIAADWIAHVRG